jgi:hypothetical protein
VQEALGGMTEGAVNKKITKIKQGVFLGLFVCMLIQTLFTHIHMLFLGYMPSHRSGRKRIIPPELEATVMETLLEHEPGKKQAVERFSAKLGQLYFKLCELAGTKKPKQFPCRDTARKLLKKLNVKTTRGTAQTLARYEAIRDHRNFISLYCALQALKEAFGRVDEEDGAKYLCLLNFFNYDESTGRTMTIEKDLDVFAAEGANGEVKLIVKKSVLKQQYLIVFGCTAAGELLPPLIGLKAKSPGKRSKKGIKCTEGTQPHREIIRLEHEEINMLFGEFKEVAPVVVVYHESDKACIGDLYDELILKPCVAIRKPHLREGESVLAAMDGVGKHIQQTREDFKDLASCRMEYLKSAANTTSKMQICDLLRIFSWIKNPGNFLPKCSQYEWERYKNEMRKLLLAKISPFFATQKATDFCDTLAVMFFVILASMTKWSIKKKWQEIGINGDFKALMSKCENKPIQAQMDHYQSQMPDMIEHMLDRGMITDCDFAKKYKVFGEANVDDKGMKSQRTVHLTHHAQRKAALNRLQAKKQDEKVKATARAEQAAVKARKAKAKALDRTGKARAKTKTDAVWKQIRVASKADATTNTATCMNRKCRCV